MSMNFDAMMKVLRQMTVVPGEDSVPLVVQRFAVSRHRENSS